MGRALDKPLFFCIWGFVSTVYSVHSVARVCLVSAKEVPGPDILFLLWMTFEKSGSENCFFYFMGRIVVI